MRIVKVIGILLLLSTLARADFVVGNTSLPTTKTNLNPLPSGADPTKYFQSSDYNALMNAALDLRTAIVGGVYHGFTPQAGAPTPLNSTYFEWLKTNGQFHLSFNGTDNLLAYGPVTTKGDLLLFDGTNYVKFGACSNNSVMSGNSGTGSGWQCSTPTTILTTTRVADGTIAANTLVKLSGSTDERVVQLGTTDSATLVVGIALQDATIGQSLQVQEVQGIEVAVKSDGTGTITHGDMVQPSTTSAGRVKTCPLPCTTGVGSAATSVAATPDVLVNVL